jgi:hypothetical protein
MLARLPVVCKGAACEAGEYAEYYKAAFLPRAVV